MNLRLSSKAECLIPFELNPHFEALNTQTLGWDFTHMGSKGPQYHLLTRTL